MLCCCCTCISGISRNSVGFVGTGILGVSVVVVDDIVVVVMNCVDIDICTEQKYFQPCIPHCQQSIGLKINKSKLA